MGNMNLFQLGETAWQGLLVYIGVCKTIVLFMAGLVYLIAGQKEKGPVKRLIYYSVLASAICVCPITAGLLMLYQTQFYDYVWLIGIVPVLPVIAYSGVTFLTTYWKQQKGMRTLVQNVLLGATCLVIIVACGRLQSNPVGVRTEATVQQNNQNELIRQLQTEQQTGGAQELCLWAPAAVLEDVRMLDGNLILLYGRNMWDISLNAYSYDTYSEELCRLYEWMEGEKSAREQMSTEEAIAQAGRLGANVILLPKEDVVPGQITCEKMMEWDSYYILFLS